MSSAAGPRFRFGRSDREALGGETLLATLARRGWPRLVRSIRYHRPRGPFCGTGDCTGCLVRVNGRPNVRACRYEPRDGDVIRTENSWPSPSLDVAGAVDRLLPNGFDTLHGLRRPAFAVPLYQRFVRRLAGYGRAASPDFHRPVLAPRTVSARAVVVGAGRSGRALARRLAEEGVRPVVVVEREPRAPALDSAELLAGVTATFLPPPDAERGGFTLLGFAASGQGYLLRAPTVVVATGGYDAALLFEGSDRPGIVAADLALRQPGLPLRRAVVVGGGARARTVLERWGAAVSAVVAPSDISSEVVELANERRIPLYPRSRVVRARGRSRVRSLEIVARGDAGRSTLACDAVILAHRRLPNAQLLFQAGAARRWQNVPGAFYPERTAGGATAVPGLWAVGSAAAPAGDSIESVVAGIVGRPAPPPTTSELMDAPATSYYRELLAERRHGKWVVCPCEDVLLSELEDAVARGFREMEVVKRYTGVGTGLCQGRYCIPDTLLVLAALEARAPPEVGTITQRPPVVPTPLVALAALASELESAEVP